MVKPRRARHPARRARAEVSSGTEAPRSHQLPLNGNFRTEEREKPTHLKEKPNKKLPGLHNTTERWLISRRARLRDRGGGGDHTHAHQPLRPWPAASAYGFLASMKRNLDLT